MRKRILFLLLLLSLSLSLTAQVLAMPTKAPPYLRKHETDDPLVLKVPPMKRPDVYELKERLKSLGLYKGSLNEIYDASTAEAVKAFQKSYWLEPTGVVDASTWRALGHGISPPKRASAEPLPKGQIQLLIDTEKAELTVLVDGRTWKTYPVAVGRWATMTPVGEWKVIEKGYEQGGAFGTRWMALDVPWGGYGIHGTNRPWSIGTYASLGCVRMFNQDVEELFDIVQLGTRVRIIGYRPPLDFGKPFGPGSVGPEVVRLQEALREFGFDPGPCDGRYGPKTSWCVSEINGVFGIGRGESTTRDFFTLLGIEGK